MPRATTGQKFLDVTPSDTVALSKGAADAFYIGVGGTVVLRGEDGENGTFIVPSGYMLHCGAFYVMASGTDATDIVAVYL